MVSSVEPEFHSSKSNHQECKNPFFICGLFLLINNTIIIKSPRLLWYSWLSWWPILMHIGPYIYKSKQLCL